MEQTSLASLRDHLKKTTTMPVLFIGHGNPMNAVEDNEFSRGWREMAGILPKPKAILCISAHWETWGSLVTDMEHPRTIHDFSGFPRALFETEYPAPGSAWLAQRTQSIIKKHALDLDKDWGLDHGCWSVLKQMFPSADTPVVQLSLDYTLPTQAHFDLARELAPLREEGVLIVGSGNIVHNLRLVEIRGNSMRDFNSPFGLAWAIEASALIKRLIDEKRYAELIQYQSLGPAVQLAVPTPEHYLPMLYALALQQPEDSLVYFNDKPVAGSLTMTSFILSR